MWVIGGTVVNATNPARFERALEMFRDAFVEPQGVDERLIPNPPDP
jgi:hypothetical protein